MSEGRRESQKIRRDRLNRRHRVLDAIYLSLIALSPLALGGTHPIAAVVLCAILLAVCIASMVVHMTAYTMPRRAWPVVAMGGLCLWVLLRSTVLGGWTNPPIAREAWALWPDLTVRGGIAPGRAGLWVIRTLTFALSAWYGTQRFVRSERAVKLGVSLIVGGVAVAVVGIAQWATNARELLWFYAPIDWTRVVPLAGPFVNQNQAAAVAGLGATAALLGIRYASSASRRAIAVLLALPLMGYVVMLGARGVMVALLATIGTLVCCLISEFLSEKHRFWLNTAVPLLLTASAIVLLYGNIPLEAFFEQSKTVNKMEIWRHARAVPFHAPVFGFGPRGFQDAFGYLGLNTSHEWIEDPESGILQLFSEHGIPIGLAACALVIWLLARNQRPHDGYRPAMANGITVLLTFVLIETVTGMGLHASSYLIGVGGIVGVAIGRGIRQVRPPYAVKGLAPQAAVFALAFIALLLSPKAIAVSLDDSRMPLVNSLKTTAFQDDALIQQGTRQAKATPGRFVLIQQMARIHAIRGDHDRAITLAQGLQHFAPNYKKPQKTAIDVLLYAGAPDSACQAMHTYLKHFGEVPAGQLVAWDHMANTNDLCFQDPQERLLVARAFIQKDMADRADTIILELVEEDNPSTAVLVEAIGTADRMNMPELASTWMDTLTQRTDIDEHAYDIMLKWAKSAQDPVYSYNKVAQAAATAFPQNTLFHILYVESYLTIPNEQRATNWYDTLLPIIQKSRTLARGDKTLSQRVAFDAGEAAWQAQHWDDVKKEYEALLESTLSAQNATLTLYRLGEAYRQEEDYFRARAYLERALDKDKNYLPAREALRKVDN